jgi:CubicO group peptidase (beta-lactamase class C family)
MTLHRRSRSHGILFCLALLLALVPGSGAAQAGSSPPAGIRGFSPERLARIDTVFRGMVDRGEVAGAVALVLQEGRPVYQRAFGYSDREAGRAMTTDAIFRIASQTKAITSVAVMMLAEEGRLSLSDPVSRFIPAYRATSVAVVLEGAVEVVPARRQITIRDLLTHSAGISYGNDPSIADRYEAAGFGRAAGFGWYTADKSEPICESMERLASLPFVAQPGERFVYGYATDILGCVVEKASGVPLDRFIRERITGPLGMRDTGFYLDPAEAGRLATVYAVGADGRVARAPEGQRGQGDYLEGPRRSFAGGAGLLSTAADYSRFLQMLLNEGELDGVRILAPSTVRLMTSDQLGPLFSTQGEGFGLGFRTLERPGGNGRVESVGTFGWGGAYGTAYWVDPVERLVILFLLQELPNTSAVAQRFPMLVYQALVDP